jgi:hypothetical protein
MADENINLRKKLDDAISIIMADCRKCPSYGLCYTPRKNLLIASQRSCSRRIEKLLGLQGEDYKTIYDIKEEVRNGI